MQGVILDWCLSQGYFRMQQEMFTYHFLKLNDILHPVHWLRIDLNRVEYRAEQRRLFRLNQPFALAVKPFVLTDETEALYARYKAAVTFDAPKSVEDWLLHGATQTVFDTYAVEIRDQERLIAVGIFDYGDRSITGIMNFYDPSYRRFSLGKYLMLQKIDFARNRSLEYYYPGYIVTNYPKFDYKLFPDKAATEVFDSGNRRWLPFSWETVRTLAADLMAGNPTA